MKLANRGLKSFALLVSGAVLFVFTSCSTQPPWKGLNEKVINEHKIQGRERQIPHTEVIPSLDPGKVYSSKELPSIKIAEGVKATVSWGEGALLELLEMKPGSTYPEQSLNEELITVVQEGSATCVVGEETFELKKDNILYLTPGSKRSIKAGEKGFKALEIFSPVRLDHLSLAGKKQSENARISFPDQGVTPSIKPNKIYNLNEVQWTALTPPDKEKTYKRSAALSRLIWGKNAMLSFVRMDPKSNFPLHIHPEDQLMITLRGSLDAGIMDDRVPLNGKEQHINLYPSNMVHSGHMGEHGADALDVFWPVRPDYISYAEKQTNLYDQVVGPGIKPIKLAEGFTFTEGQTWLKGNLYFSDMHFRADWSSDVRKSRTIRMSPDGKWKAIRKGMQTNGTIASKRGNLLVCDMFGHRVVEMSPRTGRILRTVLSKVDGTRIDGPNDLVMDLKGGIYVTDPQFILDKKKMPGTQVYYVDSHRKSKVVIPAGEYAMPNGVEISPDGKTLYVNNTWKQPGGNFVYAYDIKEDGSLTNKRKFAMLNLTSEVLDAKEPTDRVNSQADGMAVDMDGRLYVATLSGAQIFDATGVYVGTIWCEQFPVSLTFGGKNNDVLYMVGQSSVWSIQTKVKGFRVPEGMN